MFEPGTEVQIMSGGTIVETVKVVNDQRSEVVVEDERGNRTTFAHTARWNGWKMLHEGLGGERCFSERAPTYQIQPKQ